MSEFRHTEDPGPSERCPAGLLYVPVRPGPAGCTARLFRTPPGGRTAVGFTSERRLTATLGPAQPWIRLAEPAVRALAEPLGVTALTVDPPCAAPALPVALVTRPVAAPGSAGSMAPLSRYGPDHSGPDHSGLAHSTPGRSPLNRSAFAPGPGSAVSGPPVNDPAPVSVPVAPGRPASVPVPPVPARPVSAPVADAHDRPVSAPVRGPGPAAVPDRPVPGLFLRGRDARYRGVLRVAGAAAVVACLGLLTG